MRLERVVRKLSQRSRTEHGGEEREIDAEAVKPYLCAHTGPLQGATALAFEQTQRFALLASTCLKAIGANGLEIVLPVSQPARSASLSAPRSAARALRHGEPDLLEVLDLHRLTLSADVSWPCPITAACPLGSDCSLVLLAEETGLLRSASVNEVDGAIEKTRWSLPTHALFHPSASTSPLGDVVALEPQPLCEDERVLVALSSGYVAVLSLRDATSVALASGPDERLGCLFCAAWLGFAMIISGHENGILALWSVPTCAQPGSITLPSTPDACLLLQTIRLSGKAGHSVPVHGLSVAVSVQTHEGTLYAYGAEAEDGMPQEILQIPVEKPVDEYNAPFWLASSTQRSTLPWFGKVLDLAAAESLSGGAQSALVLNEGGQLILHDTSGSSGSTEVLQQPFAGCAGPATALCQCICVASAIETLIQRASTASSSSSEPRQSSQLFTGGSRHLASLDESEEVRRIMAVLHKSDEASKSPKMFLRLYNVSGMGTDLLLEEDLDLEDRSGVSVVDVAATKYGGVAIAVAAKSQVALLEFVPGGEKLEHTASISLPRHEAPSCLRFCSSDDRLELAIGGASGAILLFDCDQNMVLWNSGMSKGSIAAMSFGRDVLCAGNSDSNLLELQRSNGEASNTLKPKTSMQLTFLQLLDRNGMPTQHGATAALSPEAVYGLSVAEHAARLYAVDNISKGDRSSERKVSFSSRVVNAAVSLTASSQPTLLVLTSSGMLGAFSLPTLELVQSIDVSKIACVGSSLSLQKPTTSIGVDGHVTLLSNDGRSALARIVAFSPEEQRVPACFGDHVSLYDSEIARAWLAAETAQTEAIAESDRTSRTSSGSTSGQGHQRRSATSTKANSKLTAKANGVELLDALSRVPDISVEVPDDEPSISTGGKAESATDPAEERAQTSESAERERLAESSPNEQQREPSSEPPTRQQSSRQERKQHQQGERKQKHQQQQQHEEQQTMAMSRVDAIRAKYGRQKPPAAASTSAGEVTGQMEQNKQALHERGEKISRIQDRTQEMNDEAANFADLAEQLKEQQRNPVGTSLGSLFGGGGSQKKGSK